MFDFDMNTDFQAIAHLTAEIDDDGRSQTILELY
jgi:hypothetical protein